MGEWDSGLLTFLKKIYEICDEKSVAVASDGLPSGIRGLLELATAVAKRETGREAGEDDLLTRVGNTTLEMKTSAGEMVGFLGEAFLSFLRLLTGKARFRRSDFWLLVQEAGAQALPIVLLINFLLGIIMAFVGSVQLKQFGAEIFVANLVAIAMVREMGPMMTAIIMAGRSGASFAAQLGTMTVNEEVDALKTSGFNPIDYLVLPRLLALAVMMPLLTLFADFIGMAGGLAVGVGMLDLSFIQYIEQTRTALSPKHFGLGLIKASIYGILVAIAGCMHGIQSGRNASAVGQATTSAVVYGIVFIIVSCAITTIIYSILGL